MLNFGGIQTFVCHGATQLAIEAYPMRLNPTDIALVMALIILIGLAVGTITSRAENRV